MTATGEGFRDHHTATGEQKIPAHEMQVGNVGILRLTIPLWVNNLNATEQSLNSAEGLHIFPASSSLIAMKRTRSDQLQCFVQIIVVCASLASVPQDLLQQHFVPQQSLNWHDQV